MASLCIYRGNKIFFNIEYVLSGRIDQVEIDSEIIFDRELEISKKDWENKLFRIIIENKLHIGKGYGLHAFVSPFIKKYTGVNFNG